MPSRMPNSGVGVSHLYNVQEVTHMSDQDILGKVMLLSQEQKIILLGFLMGRLADNTKFIQTVYEGIEQFSNHER